MDCLENRATIEVWRQSLQGYQRTAWNHPTTVLRHWKKHLAREQEKARIAAGGEPKPKPPSPMAKRDEAIRNLVDEVDRLRKAPREGDLFKWGDGHERIAKVLVADALANGCSPDKIRSIANGMLRELKATTFVPKETPTRRRKRDSNVKTQKAEDVMVVTTPPSNDPASEMHRLHEILFYGDMSRDDLHTQHDIADAIVDQAIAAGYVSDVDSLVKSIAPLGTSAPDSKHSTGDRQHEKIRRVLQAAGKEGMTGAALYNKGGFYDATLEAAVSAGAIRKEGDRYFAPPSHPAT